MAEKYYSDRVTRITDPFYICTCQEGHRYWAITHERVCSVCGCMLSVCMPANVYAGRQKGKEQYPAKK